MMKILHINTNYINNALHQNMIDTLNKCGTDSKVAAPTCAFKQSVIVPKEYVTICECFQKYDRVLYQNKQRKIISYIDKNFDVASFDILHAYTVFTDGNVAYRFNKKYGIPYVVAVRNTDINTFLKYMIHLRKRGVEILKNASAIFFLSSAYKRILFEKYIPKSLVDEIDSKSFVIPNGVDNFWLENKPSEKKSIGKGKLNICFAGKLDKNKNCNLTVEACKKLIEKGYDVKYTAIGRLVDESFSKVIEENSFITHIPFLKKEELINYYRENDIFVMPSFTESFGMVYVEAMSQGLPVIYTKNEGFDGQFSEGEVGYRVSSTSSDDIVDAVENIISDYDNISTNCVDNASCFDWTNIAEKYVSIYNDIKR